VAGEGGATSGSECPGRWDRGTPFSSPAARGPHSPGAFLGGTSCRSEKPPQRHESVDSMGRGRSWGCRNLAQRKRKARGRGPWSPRRPLSERARDRGDLRGARSPLPAPGGAGAGRGAARRPQPEQKVGGRGPGSVRRRGRRTPRGAASLRRGSAGSRGLSRLKVAPPPPPRPRARPRLRAPPTHPLPCTLD
jgi:hypothetical protein